MNPKVWEASGHLSNFSDPLMDCKECKTRHRADKLIESYAHEKGEDIVADGWTDEQMLKYINEHMSEFGYIDEYSRRVINPSQGGSNTGTNNSNGNGSCSCCCCCKKP